MIVNDSHETTVPPGLPSSADLDAAEERVREATGSPWISTADQFPQRRKDVLVLCGDGQMHIAFWYTAAPDGIVVWKTDACERVYVTHWCSLPSRESFPAATPAVNYGRRQIAAQTAATPETT